MKKTIFAVALSVGVSCCYAGDGQVLLAQFDLKKVGGSLLENCVDATVPGADGENKAQGTTPQAAEPQSPSSKNMNQQLSGTGASVPVPVTNDLQAKTNVQSNEPYQPQPTNKNTEDAWAKIERQKTEDKNRRQAEGSKSEKDTQAKREAEANDKKVKTEEIRKMLVELKEMAGNGAAFSAYVDGKTIFFNEKITDKGRLSNVKNVKLELNNISEKLNNTIKLVKPISDKNHLLSDKNKEGFKIYKRYNSGISYKWVRLMEDGLTYLKEEVHFMLVDTHFGKLPCATININGEGKKVNLIFGLMSDKKDDGVLIGADLFFDKVSANDVYEKYKTSYPAWNIAKKSTTVDPFLIAGTACKAEASITQYVSEDDEHWLSITAESISPNDIKISPIVRSEPLFERMKLYNAKIKESVINEMSNMADRVEAKKHMDHFFSKVYTPEESEKLTKMIAKGFSCGFRSPDDKICTIMDAQMMGQFINANGERVVIPTSESCIISIRDKKMCHLVEEFCKKL